MSITLVSHRVEKRHRLYRGTVPRSNLRRISRDGGSSDERGLDDNSYHEVESIVDLPRELRHVPKAKLQSEPRHTPRHASSPPLPVLTFIFVYTSAPAPTPPRQLFQLVNSQTSTRSPASC